MLKLYRRDAEGLFYWEAWEAEGAIGIHRGRVGSPGETGHVPLEEGENPSRRIWLESAAPRAEGFAEWPVGDLTQVTLWVPALRTLDASVGEPAWPFVVRMLSEALGSRGLGHCAGFDPGRQAFVVLTVDPELAVPLLREGLASDDLVEGLVVTVEGGA